MWPWRLRATSSRFDLETVSTTFHTSCTRHNTRRTVTHSASCLTARSSTNIDPSTFSLEACSAITVESTSGPPT
ncbi:unnamed protein product [Zymoseptoria tritici ST99CH_3D7]|uniref:Uncharacterized protein n=1 Tax=Zymoseptoria tritici (strain ST99CH_3D7) TaxID=1276538 RepID=A0A1X7S059_ZYMT9|nr:unnamed protein product [Zymoseptoria tritici ST99CH_3D7]